MSKRIGIITFHKAHNYGAFLQCYALQTYLDSIGEDAYVIDYDNKQIWDSYRLCSKNQILFIFEKPSKIVTRFIKYCRRLFLRYGRYRKFIKSQKSLLKLQPVETIKQGFYDTIFIGSDQVWNLELTQGFDSYYWGTFDKPQHTKVATYAASLRTIWKDELLVEVFKRLNSLSAISTREQYVSDFLNVQHIQRKAVTVPDPVLLLSPNQWSDFAEDPCIRDKYLFFYEVIHVDRVFQLAKELARNKNLQFIYMHGEKEIPNSKYCLSASPAKFIGLIKNAEIVVTSSFHATVFSIMFQKTFYSVDMKLWKDYRLINTLKYFGLEKQYVEDLNQCTTIPSYIVENKQQELLKIANDYIMSVLNI